MSQRTFERDARRRQDAERRRDTLRRRRAGLAAGLAGTAALAAPAVAQADSFEVTSLTDTAAPGSTTLREAVASAEATGEDSTVTFASNVRGTITLVEGDINYHAGDGGALAIQGPGADQLTVSGDDESRIFSFDGDGSVSVSGLTLTAGEADGNSGGAINSEATDLTVSNSSIVDNTAKYGGGGIAQYGGSLTVENSHVDRNVVPFFPVDVEGGGILVSNAPLTVSGSTVDGNKATNGSGGGIAATDEKFTDLARQTRGGDSYDVEITNSSVSGNRAGDGGGGSFELDDDDVSITRSTFADNTATGSLDFGLGSRERETKGGPPLFTERGFGGGASIATSSSSIEDSTFSGNRALEPAGLTAPDLRNQSTRGDLDDIPDGTVSGVGGGLFLYSQDGSVSNSTVANNQAAFGGGIATTGENDVPTEPPPIDPPPIELPPVEELPTDGDTLLPADVRAKIKGIDEEENGISTSIDNSTVSANQATEAGGGVATDFGGFEASSSIVAGNTSEGEGPDIAADEGSVDAEYSFVQVPGDSLASAQTNITGQAAQLGGLASNGGPTKTLLPALSSPVIDKGTANELETDQRGLKRTVDLGPANAQDGTDIGAVEVQAPAQPAAGSPPARPVTPSSIPVSCSRRALSLTDARVKNGKVVLKGLVGSRFYGKKVTIQTDPEGAKASGYSKTASVTAAKKDGTFTVSVPKPSSDDYPTVRYRAKIGKATSPALKLPQSLTLKSVKSAKGTITVTGRVREAVLGKRNKVTIRRLACGRYRTMGRVKPKADGTYSLTFKATELRGVALYRAESSVLVRPESKKYVKQYARAIAIKTTGQTG